jgi:uncharacterized membrane protein
MKITKEEALKYTNLRNSYVLKYQNRTYSYINSVSVIYTTISSALILFAFNTEIKSFEEKIYLIISILLSIIIVFLTLLFKYSYSKTSLEMINSKKVEDFFKEDILGLEPKKLTNFILEKIPIFIIVLIALQLLATFLLSISRIFNY